MIPRPAKPEERATALRLLLSHLGREEREARAHGVLDMILAGEVDGRGLLVTGDYTSLRGAVLAAVVPGGGALIWPPVAPDADTGPLIEAGCDWVRSQGARLVQALLLPTQSARAIPLLKNHFRLITCLVTLCHDLCLTGQQLAEPDHLTIDFYTPATPELFHRTLMRTYEGTLDCPEITGLRSLDEVIAGHQAQGPFNPHLWWLARDRNQPIGVVIQMDNVAAEEREVGYIGIVPEARGRGHGRELLRRALVETRAKGHRQLLLAVDERNDPASRLYRRLGFEEIDRQHVYLRVC